MKSIQKHISSFFFLVLLVLLAAACAKQGYPSGGPKDVTPPKIIQALPENGRMDFNQDKFVLKFDEYVVLKDADNNILVSPPLKNKPQFTVKGHGLEVKINDTLIPNTTYQFQFKDAIADFNEGNLLPSYEYVFSTGHQIDSFSVKGSISDAFSKKRLDKVASVMLYEDFADSAVVKSIPSYVTRSDKKGDFHFSHIRPGQYRLIAVVDEDKDMKLSPSESVAFLDEAISSCVDEDSVSSCEKFSLLMFSPESTQQRINQSSMPRKGYVFITTMLPMKNPQIQCEGRVLMTSNPKQDSLKIWTLPTAMDSVSLIISDESGIQDTLKLRYKAPRMKSFAQTPLVSSNIGPDFPYFQAPKLLFSTPIIKKDTMEGTVEILNLKDSLVSKPPVVPDSMGLQATILFEFSQGVKYQVKIPQKSFLDIYHNWNDSLMVTTQISQANQYGEIKLNIQNVDRCKYIICLLDEKQNVVKEIPVQEDGTVVFEHLKPSNYGIMAIRDLNGDGKWNTGDYWKKLQPEPTTIFPKQLNVRGNWTIEETWTLER